LIFFYLLLPFGGWKEPQICGPLPPPRKLNVAVTLAEFDFSVWPAIPYTDKCVVQVADFPEADFGTGTTSTSALGPEDDLAASTAIISARILGWPA
jgi:hypothetical protein